MLEYGEWCLTAQRVALHRPTGTAVVADVHLGYAEARRRRGDAIPAPTVAEALRPLAEVLAWSGAVRVVVAGDLFEEGCRPELMAELRAWIAGVGVRFQLVPGNHDRKRGLNEADLELCPDGADVGEWLVLHGDGDLPARPVLHGHIHPAIRRGAWQWPCYLLGPTRLVLPAFSADAAGVDVLRRPEWRGCRCWVVAEGRVSELKRMGHG